MNVEKIKLIEVEGRKFQIKKMSSEAAVTVTLLLSSKVLPFFDAIVPLLSMGSENMDEMIEKLNFVEIAKHLGNFEESDVKKLFGYGLTNCYEQLSAGPVQVMNPNGTYGVSDAEDDVILALRLVIEGIMHGVSGFFTASRWTSMFPMLAGALDTFKQSVQTSMNSSSPPSSQDTGNSANLGTEPTT